MPFGRMLRSNECASTNVCDECPLGECASTNVAEPRMPEANARGECCRATNVQARMSVTIAVGECETIVVMPRQKCLKTLLNEPFSVSRKLL